jgi:hypothetical protein
MRLGRCPPRFTVCTVSHQTLQCLIIIPKRFVEGVQMAEIHNIDELRTELKQLVQKQSETLNARVFGGVSDTELIEYDLRQEVINEIQRRLARSAAA